MSYEFLMFTHLFTVLPAFILGTISLILKKGTQLHKVLGRMYMLLMLFTALVTLFMPAAVGPTVLSHFGWIHLFSFLTLYTVPTAYIAIKKGNIKSHKRKMILLYFGAIIIAGAFTFMPGRYLHSVFFG
ncbi:DUF2306 domain-containing protein [Lacinutrix sp. Bg11-31]|uniref:DUF2306 domain-containing protein n=1 Tax=Lacinutrix sp. Bg11-31 TaxID=2057808 RepID=UPI000C30BC00|nr:DUF2306 domain-containing protein [Lacinutrix sp. Bg11-31]AUC81667.1 hypothetical protein CW733_05795 [Lacinutrix sp. Bg11-31]